MKKLIKIRSIEEVRIINRGKCKAYFDEVKKKASKILTRNKNTTYMGIKQNKTNNSIPRNESWISIEFIKIKLYSPSGLYVLLCVSTEVSAQ